MNTFFNPSFLLVLILLLSCTTVKKINVDPTIKHQTLEGWGTSLSWWANLVGEYPDEVIDQICDDLTSPEELNMNVYRYNIHGGDNPEPHADTVANHFRKDSGPITSYKPSPDASFDWTANAKQRKILREVLERKPNAILEAIAYSPPYWMTKSQCSAGAVDKRSNLPVGNEGLYADFLTDIIKYYNDSLDITFRTLTGLNEPSSGYWKAGGIQEGCGVYAEQQAVLISEIYRHLQEKNMLEYCSVSGPEESKIDQTLEAITTDNYQQILAQIAQINTHSYNSVGSKRTEIADFAKQHKKRIWQSESGPLDVSINDSFENNLFMAAEQIIPDLKELKVHAWVEWQVASTSKKWGYFTLTDSTSTLTKHKNYYIRKQFSKYLVPGSTLIEIDDPSTVAALSPDENQLILVHVNHSESSKSLNYDLSKFDNIDSKVTVIRTSKTEDTKEIPIPPIAANTLTYSSPAKSVTTFVIGISL